MKLAIMQPYIFPYIGYFQLINAAEKFIIYDNIQFTKKGWINKNRILVNAKDEYISFPIKKDSDFLNINQRFLTDDFSADANKILRKIEGAYRKAPYFDRAYSLIKDIVEFKDENLFGYIFNSVKEISFHLDIKTEFIISSSVNTDHDLRAQDKVLALCRVTGASEYINAIGGVNLYSEEKFLENKIELNFIRSEPIVYRQFSDNFVPWLSIIDVLMFNSKEQVKDMLTLYKFL